MRLYGRKITRSVKSGASSVVQRHTCAKNNAISQNYDSKCGKLNLTSNKSAEIKGKGTVTFATDVDGSMKNVNLNNVLYVPELRENLLSVSKMTKTVK